jgi:hypothetical protein
MMKCMDRDRRRGITVIGIDAHKRSHTLVAIDDGGRKLAEKTVSTTSEGHAEAVGWAMERFGTAVKWSVEDNRSVTHHLERDLLAAATWAVVRCPPNLMARVRASSREVGNRTPSTRWRSPGRPCENPIFPWPSTTPHRGNYANSSNGGRIWSCSGWG